MNHTAGKLGGVWKAGQTIENLHNRFRCVNSTKDADAALTSSVNRIHALERVPVAAKLFLNIALTLHIICLQGVKDCLIRIQIPELAGAGVSLPIAKCLHSDRRQRVAHLAAYRSI